MNRAQQITSIVLDAQIKRSLSATAAQQLELLQYQGDLSEAEGELMNHLARLIRSGDVVNQADS